MVNRTAYCIQPKIYQTRNFQPEDKKSKNSKN